MVDSPGPAAEDADRHPDQRGQSQQDQRADDAVGHAASGFAGRHRQIREEGEVEGTGAGRDEIKQHQEQRHAGGKSLDRPQHIGDPAADHLPPARAARGGRDVEQGNERGMARGEFERELDEPGGELLGGESRGLRGEVAPELGVFLGVLGAQGVDNRLLVGEKLIERADRGPGALGDRAHRRRFVARFADHAISRMQQTSHPAPPAGLLRHTPWQYGRM